MRQATSVIIVSGLILFAFVPAQGADLKIKPSQDVVIAKAHGHTGALRRDDPPPQRMCDWMGPGGRAVYRCNLS